MGGGIVPHRWCQWGGGRNSAPSLLSVGRWNSAPSLVSVGGRRNSAPSLVSVGKEE
ncbi:unnamed protein product [Staurois parvus]|uniref:Uncharacterized protein n=1 Tax=Staurois parvus TaxID=386267 RepID=A0ABN9GSQ8_9NEOB|nr:unnamed protein product [Staurois parvus]